MAQAPPPPLPGPDPDRRTLPVLLGDLAARRATGVLACPAGALYLLDGQVAHVESPATPGLGTLLVRAGRLDPHVWRDTLDAAGPTRAVARRLLDTGRLTRGELELCHLATLLDAAYFVHAAARGPCRFHAGARHWLGPVRSVPVPALHRELRRRGRLLHRIWPHAQVDTAPLRPVRAASAPHPVRPRERDVLRLADGAHTPADIAAALARQAYRTLVDVRRLAAAGLVETPPGPATPPPLPPRSAGAPGPSPPRPLPSDAPDIATLRRIRDALEAYP
ncbi:transcriptional regulator [Streptomyces sp. TRM70308]|uniref:transcriptional regulator n=1 Tax=Streptomyces sp. TRM70308 TaxID=3131932 RepID=UPI003D01023C